MFTLSAREPVPRYRHKMSLCSHLEYLKKKKKTGVPTGTCCPLLCLSRRTRPCTWALRPNSGLGLWKNGVFTLMSSEYRTRALLLDTKYERCLRASNKSRQLQGNFQRSKRCHWFSSSDKCWGDCAFPCYRIKFNRSWDTSHVVFFFYHFLGSLMASPKELSLHHSCQSAQCWTCRKN